ncbi:hypothetical protein Naga_100900g2 [Nannochloropsis gaditana]|uniref:Uncharacterized protein n=1 Tax=Nannochloropsis gaditana TaxID=72520 RepID=W7THF2_9STRA|nr:hypothetical protein Naga_100900g2 [Nannochloropsis gaditana]
MHGSNARTPPQRQNTATPLSSLPPVARLLHLLGRLQLCLSVAWSILNVLSPPISNTLARLLILWCATMHVLLAFVVTIMVLKAGSLDHGAIEYIGKNPFSFMLTPLPLPPHWLQPKQLSTLAQELAFLKPLLIDVILTVFVIRRDTFSNPYVAIFKNLKNLYLRHAQPVISACNWLE